MSSEYYRRGRNWYTALGILFIVSAIIVMVRQIVLWGFEFVGDFIINGDLTNEKVSLGMICFGCLMIVLGLRRNVPAR